LVVQILFNISSSWLYKFSFGRKSEGQTTVKISVSLKKLVTRKEILLQSSISIFLHQVNFKINADCGATWQPTRRQQPENYYALNRLYYCGQSIGWS